MTAITLRRAIGPVLVVRGWLVGTVLVLVALTGLGLALADLAFVVEQKRANQLIRDLAAGRDVAVEPGDGAEALYARVRFLTERGFVDEAEALIEPIVASGNAALAAATYQSVGNARLLLAFEAGERQDVDGAVPQVTLAKDAFRRALTLTPDDFDLKVNLDLASRLVRDFPDNGEGEGEEEPDAKPKNLWTELPGVPEGLP